MQVGLKRKFRCLLPAWRPTQRVFDKILKQGNGWASWSMHSSYKKTITTAPISFSLSVGDRVSSGFELSQMAYPPVALYASDRMAEKVS